MWHRSLLLLLLITPSCAETNATGTEEGEITDEYAGTADAARAAFRPVERTILLSWGGRADVSFERATAVYTQLEVFGDVEVSFETRYHPTLVSTLNRTNRRLDTVLYVFSGAKGTPWGTAIAQDDDSGYGTFSRLRTRLSAGTYRLVIRRKNAPAVALADVFSTCNGAGCTAPSDPLPTCSGDHDFDCLFSNALPMFGGPEASLTRKVSLSELPTPLRGAVRDAVREIEERGVEGTDYAATVDGIYEIYPSPSDRRVVGYGVLGSGAGEPDFHDVTVIGFDVVGARVYAETEAG